MTFEIRIRVDAVIYPLEAWVTWVDDQGVTCRIHQIRLSRSTVDPYAALTDCLDEIPTFP